MRRIGLCLALVLLSCTEFDAYDDADYGTEVVSDTTESIELQIMNIEEVTMETEFYNNESELHIPDWAIGTYNADGWSTAFTTDGLVLSVDHGLYPNPVMPDSFLSAGGSVTEEVDADRYYVYMSATFEYKGMKLGGEVKLELIKSDESYTLNGIAVDKS